MVSELALYGLRSKYVKIYQALVAPNTHRSQYGIYQKEQHRPSFVSTASKPQARHPTTEPYDTDRDTEFEEDLSDLEEYSGRRSEDSVRSHRPHCSGLGSLIDHRASKATPLSHPTMS